MINDPIAIAKEMGETPTRPKPGDLKEKINTLLWMHRPPTQTLAELERDACAAFEMFDKAWDEFESYEAAQDKETE